MIYVGLPDLGVPAYSIPDFSIQMMGDGAAPAATSGYYCFMCWLILGF